MRRIITLSDNFFQPKVKSLLVGLTFFLIGFSSSAYGACGDDPAIFTLNTLVPYSGITPGDTRTFIINNSTCTENLVSDVYEDDFDYFIIPENKILSLSVNSIFNFGDDNPANSFPRPIRILIEGADDDATNGQIEYVKAKGGDVSAFIFLINNGSDIWFVDNATDQNIIAPAPEDSFITNSSSASEIAIAFREDPPGENIIYSYNNLSDILNRGTLPAELAYFEALPDERGVMLRWQTLWELDNDFFEMQHSIDGADFSTLEKIKGIGNSELANNYQYIHSNPAPSINYYRLKQIDFDGTFTYSSVLAVDLGKNQSNADFVVFPNPVRTRFQLFTTKPLQEKTHFFLSNTLGQVFDVQASEMSNGVNIQLPTLLPAGTYHLHIITNRQANYKRIVVQ